jgi:hypothetical protein
MQVFDQRLLAHLAHRSRARILVALDHPLGKSQWLNARSSRKRHPSAVSRTTTTPAESRGGRAVMRASIGDRPPGRLLEYGRQLTPVQAARSR